MSDNDRINGWEAGSAAAMNGKPLADAYASLPEETESAKDFYEGWREGYAEYITRPVHCEHLTRGWDGNDFLRCVDCGEIKGRAYLLPGPGPRDHIIYDARYCGGNMAEGTVLDR